MIIIPIYAMNSKGVLTFLQDKLVAEDILGPAEDRAGGEEVVPDWGGDQAVTQLQDGHLCR